jgi:hypothetical protein
MAMSSRSIRDAALATRALLLAAGLALSAVAQAAVVVAESLPELATPDDAVRADATAGPVSQGIGAAAFQGYTVTRIEWWGFNLEDPAVDVFELAFNGSALAGTFGVVETLAPFPVPNGDISLVRYFFDLASTSVTTTALNTLSLQNVGNGRDPVEWYWQAAASGNGLSYRIFGDAPVVGVPEPGSLLLVALAGLALVGTRRGAALGGTRRRAALGGTRRRA